MLVGKWLCLISGPINSALSNNPNLTVIEIMKQCNYYNYHVLRCHQITLILKRNLYTVGDTPPTPLD